MTVKKINYAIRHTGLEIVRGDGYQYFVDSVGNQVGTSVMVCYLNQMLLKTWVMCAEDAVTFHRAEELLQAERISIPEPFRFNL